MKPQRTIIPCPNCGKESVEALHYPSYLEHHTSRIAAGAKTTYHRQHDRYEIISDCPKCGATISELEKIDKAGHKSLTHEERVKRLKEAGLPTQIRSIHNGKKM